MRALAISVAIIAATPAGAGDGTLRLARAPSDMSGAEIDAYNEGRMASDPDYIRCRRIEQVGSLVKKLRVCNTNAEWKRIVDKGNQDARDSMETLARGWSVSQEPQDQLMRAPGRPQ
ncbi:hypothetical protein OVY29_17755 [Sphingopyxis sp. SE2]|jgi:hypothetical protein|uniref:hypothetical protein n=1 Tax=unclassified Sphingopyxis TaxID=2614943 RepID=UPI00050F890C|nr:MULTISPECIES: hypothetical protein [unclassified Sphingopyxis]KGB59151.1 hypothetical protein FG95_00057 [Sphingopyxis sp. LC363]MDT7530509.1 hypothetical protein [Sphingopyxis sp. SE2]